MLPRFLLAAVVALLPAFSLTSCATKPDRNNKMVVSVKDQKMALMRNGRLVKTYRISTSKFGVGDRPGSNCTPLGRLQVVSKIGSGAPSGSVFKSRRRTGEVLRPNAPGRDPIVSRIMWLRGQDAYNRNAFGRCIYIHGTPEEWRLGSPASYGCIRMSSRDVIDLYDRIGSGAEVQIMRDSLYGPAPETQQAVAGVTSSGPPA